MVKIYAVFSGSYSDRELVAVFSTLEAANQYQQFIDSDNEPREFEVDSAKPPGWWDTNKMSFNCSARVKLLESGPTLEAIECFSFSPGLYGQDIKDYGVTRFDSCTFRLNVEVIADNEDEAIHKASEHFYRWIQDNLTPKW